jgi:chaperone required for assembly of F1-ATPase
MTHWAARRFWATARAVAVPGGHGVLLDERRLRTPGKAPLLLPTAAMAAAVAAEWAAQGERIAPGTMPVTRAANSAQDRVAPQRAEVAALVAAYGGSDLLCYRARHPAALVARQAAAWDPLLDWARRRFDAPLTVTEGVMPVPQPEASLARLGAAVAALDAFRLTALHDLVALSGSLVIGLAALAEARPAAELWALSRIDEDWQAALWGADAEAEATAARRRDGFLEAHRFARLCRDEGCSDDAE